MVRTFIFTISLLLILSGIPHRLLALDDYSLVQSVNTQGLSNSAVLSLYRDDQGVMWFGTYDGLNGYNGKKMEVFRTDVPLGKPLLNNSIYDIDAADNNHLWISTLVGVNRFSLKKRQVVGTYQVFKEEFQLFSNRKGDTWVVDKGHIYYYSSQKDSFVEAAPNKLQSIDKNLYLVDGQGALWQFLQKTSQICCYQIRPDGGLATEVTSLHSKAIIFTFSQGGLLNFVDEDYDLFLYDLEKRRKIYIRNIGMLIEQYGKLKGIVSFHDDIILGFEQNGLIKLDAITYYKESVIDNSFRIFSIYKDPVQDIIWVGTDGQGVFAYSSKKEMAVQLMFSQLQNKITRQVRSIYTDTLENLWFGTKGDGLVKVEKYQDNIRNGLDWQNITVYFPGKKARLMNYERPLSEFQVFGIAASRYKNGFWLGSAENPALSFYDYLRDMIYPVKGDISMIQKVHQIYEENDSILWMTTSGTGLCRVLVKYLPDGTFEATHVKQFAFKEGKKDINDFFPMYVEGDSVMWLGSRGMGLIRFNFHTEAYKVYLLGGKDKFAINDILAICPDNNRLYLGTVSGLVQLEFDQRNNPVVFCIGKEQGFLNDMIHGILKDENGFLWLSTNKGLVKYNPTNHAFHTFYYTNGLQIGEFSDDAFYQCAQTGDLFFGGTDGILFLEKERMNKVENQSSISFYGLEIGGGPVNFYDYYDEQDQTLVLKGVSSAFSISFVAPDFIEGDNFEYSYQMDDNEWSPFTTMNVASFKSLSYGSHVLKVKYKKDVFDSDFASYELKIDILPPWYLSIWFCITYLILLMVGAVYLFRLFKRHFHQEKLIKELMIHEAYNASLNSTAVHFHELMTSYSTIFKACGELHKIVAMPDDYYSKVDRIYESALACAFRIGRSNHEFIDLGKYFPENLTIYGPVSVKDTSNDVIRMLIQNGYNNLSDLQVGIIGDLSIVLSEDAFRFLLYFIYQQVLRTDKPATVKIWQEDTVLVISAEMSLEICQYVLETSKQTGIQFNDGMSFNVYIETWLFVYAVHGLHVSLSVQENQLYVRVPVREPVTEELYVATDTARKKVLLLESHASMVWLIKEILQEKYAVVTVTTLQEAFAYLRKQMPDVFWADTMIYLSEKSKFFDYMQANKGLLMHIAFIPLITWKTIRVLDRVNSNLIDGFVVMPYDILFLKRKIDIAIARTTDKKHMFEELLQDETSFRSEENVEKNAFMKRLTQILDENLDREDLGSSFLAENMSMSSRQFYRKFKELTGNSPSEFIKSYRIEKAARLLEETELSVSDVICEVGIVSRSYFYKEFSYKYGMTPREYRDLKKKGSSHN